MRCTFADIHKMMDFDKDTHILKIRGKEIGFVYYRVGYQVEQYTSEQDWETRKTLEISQAIKCPSIDYHLTTFKKFQQSFCNAEIMKDVLGERYADQQPMLQKIFKGLWTLEDY